MALWRILSRTLADMSEKEAKRLLKKHGIPYDKISLTEDEGHDPAERLWVISSDGECFKHDWSNDYVRDTVYEDETGGVTFGQRCLYCDVERRGSLSGDVHWDMAAEEPSVYWWIKGALMEKMKDDREVTIDDVENIILMVAANAPLNSIDKGMKEAEQLGDKTIWEMLKLAAIGRSEILTEDQIHSEKLRDFQAEEYTVADEDWSGRSCEDCYEEIKKGDLIHDDGYGILICKKCYSNYKIPCEHEACDERFKDKDEEREHRQETCNRCGGEGWVMTHYTPATYHDPADVDGEDCEECWGEGWVCDKFNAEDYPTTRPNCKCGATLEWDNTRKAWYCTKCPFNTYKAEGDECSNCGVVMGEDYQAVDCCGTTVCDKCVAWAFSVEGGKWDDLVIHGIQPSSEEKKAWDKLQSDGDVFCHKCLEKIIPNAYESHWAESFSAEQGNEIVGFCENKEGFCFTNVRTYVCDKCNHCYVGCEDRDGDIPDVGCKCLYAESFSAESNGDKQLDLAVKRTKMSAVRTGLAITTFALVMWNVWTNKKQEKDIADIMTLI